MWYDLSTLAYTIGGVLMLALCAVAVTIAMMVWHVEHQRSHYTQQGFPVMADEWPLLGSLPTMLQFSFRDRGESFMMEHIQKMGPMFFYSVGPTPRFQLCDPEYISFFFRTPSQHHGAKPSLLKRVLGRLLGESNVFLTDGDAHKHHRSLLSPAFTHANVQSMIPIMSVRTAAELRKWSSQLKEMAQHKPADSSPSTSTRLTFDFHRELSTISLHALVSAFFGADLKAFGPVEDIVYTNVSAILPQMALRFSTCVETTPLLRDLSILGKATIDGTRSYLETLAGGAVEARRLGRTNSQVVGNDLLDLLMRSHKDSRADGLTDEEVMSNSLVVIAAGHVNVANFVTWAMYMLMQHPEVLSACRAEIDPLLDVCASVATSSPSEQGEHANLGDDDAVRIVAPAEEDVAKMPVLDAVLQETLRLYPPTGVMFREAVDDFTIAPPGKKPLHVCKGTTLSFPLMSLHRLPEYWGENADKFDHTRWMQPQRPYSHSFAFLPFGSGSRMCLGNHVSLTAAKVILTMLLYSYDFELVPNQCITPEWMFFLRPKYGMQMYVKARNRDS